MLNTLVLPAIGRLRVSNVRQEDLDQLHRQVSETRPVRANRMAQLLSKMFNLAVRWGYCETSPALGIRKNPETKRTRYLSDAELSRLLAALEAHDNRQSANVVRLLLLTGARRGEVLSASWDQFDLDAGLWIKPSAHTKQKKEHRVPLSAEAVRLLRAMKNEDGASPYLFPGKTPDQPQTDLKHFWDSICRQANLPDCRLHDLRHTYASILASEGLSLYSHLFDEPLREATDRVARRVTSNGASK
jgi:integrase